MNSNKLDRKLVVRVSEDQWNKLQLMINEQKVSMSQIVRDGLMNKLHNINIDDYRRRKFRF